MLVTAEFLGSSQFCGTVLQNYSVFSWSEVVIFSQTFMLGQRLMQHHPSYLTPWYVHGYVRADSLLLGSISYSAYISYHKQHSHEITIKSFLLWYISYHYYCYSMFLIRPCHVNNPQALRPLGAIWPKLQEIKIQPCMVHHWSVRSPTYPQRHLTKAFRDETTDIPM